MVWSEEIFRILGYDRRSKPPLDLVRLRVHPEDKTLHDELIERAIRDKQDFHIAHRLLMPSGFVKHVEVAGQAVSNESGEVEFVGSGMDVPEVKSGQQSLEQAFQAIKALTDQIPWGNIRSQ